MNPLWFDILLGLACVGFFCAGWLWGQRGVLYWRIKWIELEHDSARAEGREPRNISVVEKSLTTKKT